MVSQIAAALLALSAARAVLAAAPTPAAPAPAATPAVAKEDKGDATALAGKVQKAYEGVKDLSASFAQEGVLKTAGKAGPKSSGQVWIARPGKMRWEFQKPDVKTFVSDGATMWMFDGEENQVIVNEHMAQTSSVTALNFLQGLGKLQKDFSVAMTTAPANAADAKAQFLLLKPKNEEDIQVAQIVLGIDRKSSLAEEVFLIDQLGNTTHIAFTNVVLNKGVPAKTFTFEIPKGAQVIKPALVQ